MCIGILSAHSSVHKRVPGAQENQTGHQIPYNVVLGTKLGSCARTQESVLLLLNHLYSPPQLFLFGKNVKTSSGFTASRELISS